MAKIKYERILNSRQQEMLVRNPKQKKPVNLVKANLTSISTGSCTQTKRGEQRPVVTPSGKAKAASREIHSFKQPREAIALLKILALGHQQFVSGKVKRFDEVVDRLKNKYTESRKSKFAQF